MITRKRIGNDMLSEDKNDNDDEFKLNPKIEEPLDDVNGFHVLSSVNRIVIQYVEEIPNIIEDIDNYSDWVLCSQNRITTRQYSHIKHMEKFIYNETKKKMFG